MIDSVKNKVNELLGGDKSGHGMDHINRVLNLSLKFAEKENANRDIVALIALLHDADDYKLFGEESAKNHTNAKRIMSECNIDTNIQDIVCAEISNIGYSKRLKGIMPTTLEGKIVSDADMCDAEGANGIIRTHAYNLNKGCSFFDKNIFPVDDINADKYKGVSTSVCHFFDKLLRLKNLMLTESGKEESLKRHKIMVDFLYQLFDEEDVPEWKEYLDNFLNNVINK